MLSTGVGPDLDDATVFNIDAGVPIDLPKPLISFMAVFAILALTSSLIPAIALALAFALVLALVQVLRYYLQLVYDYYRLDSCGSWEV